MIRLFVAAALPCALSIDANARDFLAGVRSVNVTMTREETCVASQQASMTRYRGKRTASGERFNTYAMTAAHKTRRFGSHVTVTNLVNGRFTRVRINDRGPFVRGRCIDLSRAAADAIGMGGTARAPVQ